MSERRTFSVNDVKISLSILLSCMVILGSMAYSFGETKEKVDNLSTSTSQSLQRTEKQIDELNKRMRELEKSASEDRLDHAEFKANQKAILEELKRLRRE